jgi:YVTN family beta-propeller protein
MKMGSTIGMNGFAQALKKIFSDRRKSEEDNFILKTYEDTEDHFFKAANDRLRNALNLDEPRESYESDLKRFGTRITLIDVADDAIPNRRRKVILPLKGLTKSSRDRYTNTYEDDLTRFGTHQGVINVSNDNCKMKTELPAYPDNFSKAAYEAMMAKWKKKPVIPFSVNPFSDIFRDFPKLQITVHNSSAAEQEVTLWGGNQQASINGSSSSTSQNVISLIGQVNIPSQFYPQGIVVNPANELVYIVNQLSGTVTVLNSLNVVVQTIQLFPTFPGFCSPITLAVNTKVTSSTYGFIYIVCSVSNTVVVIDLSFNILATIPVGVRPVGIAFNPTNICVYVSNLVSNSLTVIDAELLIEVPLNSPLPTGLNPVGVGVQLVNGDVYCTNSADDTISLYNNTNEPIMTILGLTQYPVSATYNPSNNIMYVVAMETNLVYLIETVTYTIVSTIVTGIKPFNSFFNVFNNYLYIQNTVDNTFTIIKSDNTLVPNTSVAELNIGGAYNIFNNSIYVSDTINNTINVLGINVVNLTVNTDYFEMREDFQSNVGIIQHTKFVVTGPERINSFRQNRFTPTGTVKSHPISFELYASPQSKLNVAEVTALAGKIIDGKMNWKFKLPGLHTVTILIWYRYFEVRDLLTNNFNTNNYEHEKQTNVPDSSLHCNTRR